MGIHSSIQEGGCTNLGLPDGLFRRPAAIVTDGFAIVSGVLKEEDLAPLDDADFGARSRAGARHLMRDPSIAKLALDPRLLSIAAEVVGLDAQPYRATLFDKSPAANWLVVWHQDTALPIRARRDVAGWGPWSVKAGIDYAHAPARSLDTIVALRVHLDDSTADNGPLRVLPASHRQGVLSDSEIHKLATSTKPRDCTVGRGGVIVMRPLLVHASSKLSSDRPRRVIHIEYASNLALGDGLELAIA